MNATPGPKRLWNGSTGLGPYLEVWYGFLVMLRKLSDQVRDCLARAQECGHKAEHAANNVLRDDYIQLQRQWLNLAHSHQIAEGLLSAFYEHDSKRCEFLKGES